MDCREMKIQEIIKREGNALRNEHGMEWNGLEWSASYLTKTPS